MKSNSFFTSLTCFLFFALAVILSPYVVCGAPPSEKTAESEKIAGRDLVFLLTPEFRQKVSEFKISPFEAALILFRDSNLGVTSAKKLKGISSYGTLRCIKGNDYVFSTMPYIPSKGMPMDGTYVDGFTGEYRVILYSPNHPENTRIFLILAYSIFLTRCLPSRQSVSGKKSLKVFARMSLRMQGSNGRRNSLKIFNRFKKCCRVWSVPDQS